MRPTRICCASRPHCYTCADLDLDIAAPSSRKEASARQEGHWMNDEGRGTGGLDRAHERAPRQRSRWGRRSPYGYPRHDGAQAGPRIAGRPMPRSISAPTIAGCWSRVRPATASASSTPSPASSGSARGCRRPAASAMRRSRARSRRSRICRDKMRNRGVTRARLIATEACRAAENGAEFRARIAEEVGLELEIIDRETEATLAATGCTPLIDPQADGVILFDIGGGSSELVRLDRSPPCRRGPPLPKIKAWVSLPVGVVTLAERHGGHAVTPRDLRGHDRGGGGASSTASSPSTAAGDRPRPPARHLRHGDDHRRRASRAAALRAPPGRRLLDERRRGRRA